MEFRRRRITQNKDNNIPKRRNFEISNERAVTNFVMPEQERSRYTYRPLRKVQGESLY
jgi:hypothetical protein